MHKHLELIVFFTLFMAAVSCSSDKAPSTSGSPVSPAVESGGKKGRQASCRAENVENPPSGEGMWPWDQLVDLDAETLKKRGLKVPLEDLWMSGEGGLAGAAVGLKGCTASFISPDGLLITNHHCAFRAIQRNSTPENNLLEKGFVAASREDELDGHGVRVLVFKRQTDVTDDVLGGMKEDATDIERIRHIEDREKELVKRCEETPDTRCSVSRYNDGLSFVLLEKLEIRDVRLVAAPPRAVGEYGGDTDNWMWPRHTMDFTLLRAYVDKEGKPADFDPSNVPHRPKHHFRISSKGIEAGDLIMVAGTPASTSRYRSSSSVQQDENWYYPLRRKFFLNWIKVLRRTCKRVPESCLPSSSLLKGLQNGLKHAQGTIDGLERSELVSRKLEEEEQWAVWVAMDEARKKKYEGVLTELRAYVGRKGQGRTRDFLIRYMLRGIKLVGFARTITKWAFELRKKDEARDPGYQERDRDDVLSNLVHAQRSFHPDTDRNGLILFIKWLQDLPPAFRLKTIDQALKGSSDERAISAWVDRLLKGTKLGDEKVRKGLFGKRLKDLKQSPDAMIQLALGMAGELDEYEDRKRSRSGALSRLRPPYIRSLIEMRGIHFYPDANGSPRISFATVTGYTPRDGVRHTPFTTLRGMLAKNSGKKDFRLPKDVAEKISTGEYGSYVYDGLKSVPLCFLSNADTTGGNSGSPALDGRGRLVGLNFDRVYENIAGDYGYNPELSRNIMVDVRSILWYLDVVLEADHIMKEIAPDNS